MQQARLILQDGTCFNGTSFGAEGEALGEVVFNTSMTGYQEILTDPSYKNQIVTMTYSQIGNYGINSEDVESSRPHVSGFIVKEYCHRPSNWRSELALDSYLRNNNIIALADIDTRALTKKLRTVGTMKGIITTQNTSTDDLLYRMHQYDETISKDLVNQVSTDSIYRIGYGGKHRVVLLDCGTKNGIICSLVQRNCQVTVVPASTSAEEIINLRPDGIVLSNGPGDPSDVKYVVNTVQDLLGKKPILGICLGHQVLALACGATTYKLKFGHRGGNHPVKDLLTNRVHITSQNHGYAVSTDSFPNKELEITHINLTDNTVEGIKHKKHSAFSVQYHPESCPGPQDNFYIFDQFISSMQGGLCHA